MGLVGRVLSALLGADKLLDKAGDEISDGLSDGLDEGSEAAIQHLEESLDEIFSRYTIQATVTLNIRVIDKEDAETNAED